MDEPKSLNHQKRSLCVYQYVWVLTDLLPLRGATSVATTGEALCQKNPSVVH